jgi:hypothetical protein
MMPYTTGIGRGPKVLPTQEGIVPKPMPLNKELMSCRLASGKLGDHYRSGQLVDFIGFLENIRQNRRLEADEHDAGTDVQEEHNQHHNKTDLSTKRR